MNPNFVSRFTPSLMNPETLEQVFVQREPLAQRLVDTVRESVLTPSKHFNLLVGPRGIGKTHLVSIVYHRIQAMEDLQEKLVTAWLREEEWGVSSFLDFLLRIFRALLAEQDNPDLSKRVEELYKMPQATAERAAGTLLKEFVGDRTLFLIMENMDDLFEGLGDSGQKRFRAYLQENSFITILATSQSLLKGVSQQSAPFYGFFSVHHLEALSFEVSVDLLAKIAEIKGDTELESFIRTPEGRARIRAVRHLAGGNHRIYIIFSEFLTRESLDQLVEPFMRMLDDLTPYYQSRMHYLSSQQRKIVEFLCERRGAVTVREIAERGFITPQTASGQLKDLKEKGYVTSTGAGRESYYELREPLMRLTIEVKKNRGEPIRLLVDFLRLWHSKEELEEQLKSLRIERSFERKYIIAAIKEAKGENPDPKMAACLKDWNDLYLSGNYESALQVSEDIMAIEAGSMAMALRSISLYGLGRFDEADGLFFGAIQSSMVWAWPYIAKAAVLVEKGRAYEALQSADKAIELEPQNREFKKVRGRIKLVILEQEKRTEGLAKLAEVQTAQAILIEQFDGFIANNRFEFARELLAGALRTREMSILSKSVLQGVVRLNINTFTKHNILSVLGQELVSLLPSLWSSETPGESSQAWGEVWQEAAANIPELEIPVRLTLATIRYRENRDVRVLLELPIEERRVLEEALGIEGVTGEE